MEYKNLELLEKALKELLIKSANSANCDEALKYTQAVLNLTNASHCDLF